MVGAREVSAPLGFENRLFDRLDALEKSPVQERKLLPNTLAFASGMTIALIAGAVYMNNQLQPVQSGAFAVNETGVTDMLEIAEDSTVSDTALMKMEPWGNYWNIEAVSTLP